MIYDVKPNICICIFVSNGRSSFVLEVRRRVLGFSKYHKIYVNFTSLIFRLLHALLKPHFDTRNCHVDCSKPKPGDSD